MPDTHCPHRCPACSLYALSVIVLFSIAPTGCAKPPETVSNPPADNQQSVALTDEQKAIQLAKDSLKYDETTWATRFISIEPATHQGTYYLTFANPLDKPNFRNWVLIVDLNSGEAIPLLSC